MWIKTEGTNQPVLAILRLYRILVELNENAGVSSAQIGIFDCCLR